MLFYNKPFHTQDLIRKSPSYLLHNFYRVGSKNLVLDQLIPVCLCCIDIVWRNALMGAKGLRTDHYFSCSKLKKNYEP